MDKKNSEYKVFIFFTASIFFLGAVGIALGDWFMDKIDYRTATIVSLVLFLFFLFLTGFFSSKQEDKPVYKVLNNSQITEVNDFSSYEYVLMDSSVNSYVPKIFYGSQNLKNIEFYGEINCIPEDSFFGCTNLEEVVFSNKVEVIGKNAFGGCKKLKHIYYYENGNKVPLTDLTYVSKEAFTGCDSLSEEDTPEQKKVKSLITIDSNTGVTFHLSTS